MVTLLSFPVILYLTDLIIVIMAIVAQVSDAATGPPVPNIIDCILNTY